MTMRRFWTGSALCLAMALAACGGGSGRGGTDLKVTGVGPSGQVAGGGVAVFVMTVENRGDNDASDVTIVDTVGNQLSIVGITCKADHGATCPDDVGISMSVPNLPSGGTLTFEVSAKVADEASGSIVNEMSANFSEESDRSDNSATVSGTAYTPTADVAVSGTGPTDSVDGGATAQFVMTVTNSGPDAATAVRIVESVTGNLTITDITCTASGGAACPTPAIAMNLDSLPAGGTLAFTVSAHVARGSGTEQFANTLTVTTANDPNRDNNTAVVNGTSFTPVTGLTVTGTGPAGTVTAGGPAAFTMTVRNAGPDAATGLKLVDTPSANITLTGGTCTASGGAVCPASVTPSMSVDTLPPGGTLVFQIGATVDAGVNGSITNTLAVNAPNDADTSDNTAVASGNAASNNLTVSGSAPTTPIAGGSTVPFTMKVTNQGPGTSANVALTDTVSDGLELQKPVCVATGGAVCPASLGATMTAPLIPAGGALTFTVPTVVTAGAVGTLKNTLKAVATGDTVSGDNSASVSITAISPDLGVSQTGPSTVARGTSAVFTAVVANPGPGAANGISIVQTLTAGYTASITCTPSSGATCPTTLAPSMSVASLPAGRSLTFTFTVPVGAGATAPLVNGVVISSGGDANAANNSASVSAVPVDVRSGSYQVFATNGQSYDMTIDFDQKTYTMAGNGSSVTRSFTADASGGGYTVKANSRFRTAAGLIVGGHDFGAGVLPYVAVALSNFGTSLGEAGGTYNLATRNLGSGSPVSHAGTAQVTGNTLLVCQSDNSVTSTQSCPAGALKTYTLSVDTAGLYTGVENASGEIYTFRLALSGAAQFLISAGPAADGSNQWRLGVIDASALAGGTQSGASTTGDWLGITLDASNYSVTASGGATDHASLAHVSASRPAGLLVGTRDSDGQVLFVMQASPLAVVVGAPGATGSAQALVQVAIP